jgi:tetratricopeptide (TPR) repeat protein
LSARDSRHTIVGGMRMGQATATAGAAFAALAAAATLVLAADFRAASDPEGSQPAIPADAGDVDAAAQAPRPPLEEPRPDQPGCVESVDELLARARGQLREARFEEALETIHEARRCLETAEATSEGGDVRAQLEVVAATVYVAFEREEEAIQSLERALRADPDLEIDATTSPAKLVRAVDAARARLAGSISAWEEVISGTPSEAPVDAPAEAYERERAGQQ